VEAQDEYGPIGAISLKAGNVGGKELDERNGHYQKNVAAVFVELDLGRAHNLLPPRQCKHEGSCAG